MATLGKNQVFEIKNGDGTSFHNLVLRKSAVESIVMSLGDKISGDVYYKDNSLSVTMHEYITYNGVNYMLVNPPTIVREGIVSDNSELKGMTKYSFVFYHPMYQLANFPFTDVAVTSDETRYLSEGKTFPWIGKPADFVAKLNKNLTGTEWIVEISSRFPQDKLDELSNVIQFDNATIADACKTFYDTWGVPYVVDKVASTEASYATGKRFKLVMGLPSNEIYENESARQLGTPYVFQMGQGVGLKNNSRTPRNNKIVTRIAGYGSEDNVPYGYPQIVWTGNQYWDYTINNDPDNPLSYPIYKGIVGGQYVKLIKHPFTRTHLMPSIFTETVNKKVNPNADGYDPTIEIKDYYDAVATQEYPYVNEINLQAPSYESHEFTDIKPELDANRSTGIVSAVPLNSDLTPADHWDDAMDDDGNYLQSYFQITLPQLSFDLYACAAITQEMQINMRSGACIGCTFPVQVDWDDYKRNFYDEEGNFVPDGEQRDLTKYPKSNLGQISVVVQKDNTTFGTLMPNIYQQPKANDLFVFIGISLPLSYITNAEERLDDAMKTYMLENNVYYFDYPLKFDEHFLATHTYILEQIRPNSIIRFDYGGVEQQLFIKQLTVKYGNAPLPQYDITLTDNVEVVLNQIGQVAEDVEKLSTLIAILRQSYGKNIWSELAKKLSKTQDDTAAGYITMLKGLQVGANFVPDILGEGGVLRMNNDGKVELVVDTLYARMRAYFDSVVIREYRHESGNRIKSPAQGFNASRVEYIKVVDNAETIVDDASEADYFRCYWRVDDGEKKSENQFVVGDLAFCEHSDIVNGSLVTKRYWRVVTGRNAGNTTTADGEAWIDLSNAHDASGNPVMATITYTGQGGTTQTKSVLSFESGSDIPESHDDICMLGCVTDSTRQGAIIEYVSGTNAPSYQIYQSIGSDDTNPYVLTNKNQITIGYNSATGKAELKVYGDAFIGDPNRTTYIEYVQDDGTDAHAPKLKIKAEVEFTNSKQDLDNFVQSHQKNYDDTEVRGLIDGLQDQIDGQVESWFYNYAPVHVDEHGAPDSKVPLNIAPYSDWTTEADKIAHLGDTFTDNSTGYCWRFSRNEDTNAFEWVVIEDSALISALQKASKAQETADNKRRVFLVQPTPPYDAGDIWVNATYPANYTGATDEANHKYNNDILKCITAKASGGSFSIEDWTLSSKYTDDTKFNGYISALLNNTGLSGDAAAAAAQRAVLSALGVGTVVSGGLLLTSLIGMRQYNGSGDKSDVNNYTTWAGISGEYDANVKGGGIAAWYGGSMVDHEVNITATDYAKSLFRFDGSGYMAGGNITWDAQGRVAIKDITTLIAGSDTNILNALTTFNNAFHFNTQQGTTTVLSIVPQAGFTSLNITENGTLKPVATQEWANRNFVTKTFFDSIFRLYNGTTKVNVNDTIPSSNDLNIEAMFGFWTKKYISALGQGDDGSTSYTTLAQLNDVSLSNPTANQVLTYNGSHWVNSSISLGSQTLAGLSDVTISSPAEKQMLGYDATTQKWKNIAIPATGVTSVALSMPTGFSINGSPITASGTFAVTYASGYSLPTTAKQSNWDTAYGWGNHASAGYALAANLGTASGHAHSDYLTSLSWDSTNNKLAWAKGGTAQIAITIGYASAAGSVAWGNVSSKPTTIGGYGITDAYTKTQVDSLARLKLVAFSSDGVLAFTLQDGSVSYVDLTHQHDFQEILDKPTTLAGFGITDAKIESGVITLGSNTITPVTSVAMTVPTGLSVSGTPITKTGTLKVTYASGYEGFTTDLKNKINALFSWFEVDENGDIKTKDYVEGGKTKHRGFWSPSFVSALGQGSDGGGGGQGDVTWTALANEATGGRTIHQSYIADILSRYATISWVTGLNYATQTWVEGKGYATTTQLNALEFLSAVTGGDGIVTLTTNKNNSTILDLSHEHSFLELLDRPTTLGGYGVTLTADDIPMLTKSKISDFPTTWDWANITNKPTTWAWTSITGKPTTVAGYGITDAKIVDGVITLGAVNITPITSVAMTVPSGFSISGSPISKAGILALSYASGYEGFTTELKNKINSLFSWFEVDADGNVKTKDYTDNGTTKHRGFYSPSFVSALGQGSDGQSGVGDVTWDLLATQATNNRTIHLSYISAALASYLTTNSYVRSSAISDMATKTWVGQQGYLTSSALANYYTKSEVYTKTEINAMPRVKAIALSEDCITFTWQDNSTTIADFSHEHSFLELLDRPSTIAGYGISLTADDIPNLPWGKITSGKPTTIGGYGITDAVTSVKIGTNSYAPASGIVTLPAYPTNYYSNTDSHTANTVLAAPNGSNGVATFRSLVAADIPTLTKSKISDFPTSWAWSAITGVPTTLAGYGITDAKIVDGVIMLGANTITPVTSVALTMPTGFSVSGSPISKTGTFSVSYASGYEGFTTTLKDKINLLYSLFTREGSGTSSDPYVIKANYGLYTEKFLSALGQGDDGQSGVGDVTWELLAGPATNNRSIHSSYISSTLAAYATQSWVTNQNYATQTWVTGKNYATQSWVSGLGYTTQSWVTNQGYATTSSVTTTINALTYFNAATVVDGYGFKLSGHGVEDAYIDITHEHSWFELLDRPSTLTGFGITIAASDIPNLDWSKITTGKPTTLAGYGITDAVASISINGTSYLPSNKVVTLPVYTSTQVDALARLKTLALTNDGVLTFTHQDNSTSVVDFSHEHSFLELLDRPTSIKGYGITILESDVPNLPWSKITSGKPTTVAGYGITDAITTGNIGNQSVNYATTAGGVSWANVSNKPSAAGNGTTPVYWTGSGFTACTPYSSASVNYANSAGSASQLSTPRTLWGQSFDGTGNVSGNLSSIGHLSFGADNTYDVGASGTRARSGYFGTYLLCDAIEIGHTNEINTTSGVLYLQYRSPATNLVLCYNGGNVGVGNSSPSYRLDVSGVIYSNTGVYSAGYVTALSDARHKTIVRNTNISVEQIAAMRSVVYRWSDRRDDSMHVGSIAQDWQGVLPQVVSVADDKEHTLGLQYGVAALISAITVARKVMTHEEKIALLETRVSALEKENGEQEQLISTLQEELAKFKAA